MLIDFSQELKSLSGEPFLKEEGKVALLGDMCVAALLSEKPNAPAPAVDKLKRWELAKLVYGKGEVELKAEDIVLIKKAAGEVFAPALMGVMYDLLEV